MHVFGLHGPENFEWYRGALGRQRPTNDCWGPCRHTESFAELGKQSLFESWIESPVTFQGVLTLQITVGIRFDMQFQEHGGKSLRI